MCEKKRIHWDDNAGEDDVYVYMLVHRMRWRKSEGADETRLPHIIRSSSSMCVCVDTMAFDLKSFAEDE